MRDRKAPITSATRLPSRDHRFSRAACSSTSGAPATSRPMATPWTSKNGQDVPMRRAQVISKNRDFIVGVKARLSRDVAGENDYEVPPAHAGRGNLFRPARDDPHGADHLAASQARRPAEAQRRRYPYVRAATQQHHRRARSHPAGSACSSAPRRLVRRRQWAQRAHALGHHRRHHESRFLAGHFFHRLERQRARNRRHRLAQLHVEAVSVTA